MDTQNTATTPAKLKCGVAMKKVNETKVEKKSIEKPVEANTVKKNEANIKLH